MNWHLEMTDERVVSVNDMEFTIVVDVFSSERSMLEMQADGYWDVVYVPQFMCEVQIWNETEGGMEPFATDISIGIEQERNLQIHALTMDWLNKAEEHLKNI